MNMEHGEAAASVERYVLGELDDETRERFEEHMFECVACAADVEDTQAFLDAARPVVGARAPPRARFWPLPAAAAALLLLAGVVGWQQLELRAARAPQAATWGFLAVSRGAPVEIAVARGQTVVGLTLALPPGPRPERYRCALLDGAGTTLASFELPPPRPGRELELTLPASRLATGEHVVTVAGDEGELARYPFTVTLEN